MQSIAEPEFPEESRLPKWAQKRLIELREELQRLRAAHQLLSEHRWFTIHGPRFTDDEDFRRLFILDKDAAVSLCSLGKGDVLMVGRCKDD